MPILDESRLFLTDPTVRALARGLYEAIKYLPIVSPYGHTDPSWFAENAAFPDPAQMLVTRDHYLFCMLHLQGIVLEGLGVPRVDGGAIEQDGCKIWRLFAANYHLFSGTPSRIWVYHALQEEFGVDERLSAVSADAIYDHIDASLQTDTFRPRALSERFNIEAISTTASVIDDLQWHKMILDSGWNGKVMTAYRTYAVIDSDFDGFADNFAKMGEMAGEDVTTWEG